MELSIERNELLAGLYLVQGVVERRTTIPILANVLLQGTAEGATLAATDNEVGRQYVRRELGVPACNALRDAPALVTAVREGITASTVVA